MGLNLDGKVVDVDHSHNQFLSTGRSGNPVVQNVANATDKLTVYSAFQRHKVPRNLSRDPDVRLGDNCHFLYALKGKNGLTLKPGAYQRLMENFGDIIGDMVEQSGKFDVVVPMPSSHAISQTYAQQLATHYGCAVSSGLFSKISLEQAREMLKESSLTYSEKRQVAHRLGDADGDFSLKNIPVEYRVHFPPLILQAQALQPGHTRFLLADDLLATGTTLLAAQSHIKSLVPGALIVGSCLFSAV